MTDTELFLAFDLGSTRLKGGLFDISGTGSRFCIQPFVTHSDSTSTWAEPDQFITSIRSIVLELTRGIDPNQIRGIGICSMAESGLLVDAKSLAPASKIIPWFDRGAEQQAEMVRSRSSAEEVFLWSGIRPTFKCPLARLIALRDENAITLIGKVWLSAADYLAALFTGKKATDHTLAGRTLAYDINGKKWHAAWLKEWRLEAILFPEAVAAGQPMGVTTTACKTLFGIPEGIQVSIAGHDHVCAASALSSFSSDAVVDSMGTAETLMGAIPDEPLTSKHFHSGLNFGVHVLPGKKYWMGALSTSGGALEWLRTVLGGKLTYQEIEQDVSSLPSAPGTLVFLPYLSGSGAPHSDGIATSSWLGLKREHGRSHLFKAILEGTACEMEYVRRHVKNSGLLNSENIIVTGGGSNNQAWLQIKANLSGCTLIHTQTNDAALTGAAMIGCLASGLVPDFNQAANLFRPKGEILIRPDQKNSQSYQEYFERLYLPAIQTAHSLNDQISQQRFVNIHE